MLLDVDVFGGGRILYEPPQRNWIPFGDPGEVGKNRGNMVDIEEEIVGYTNERWTWLEIEFKPRLRSWSNLIENENDFAER